ncbi:MAG: DUF402 domain-containing protein [Anaerosacchariphilus sp.]
MVQHPTLIRKRLIPLETLRLEKDVVIHRSDRLLVTRWTTIKPKKELHHGSSCFLLKEGWKVSRFIDHQGKLICWYCDIIATEYDADTDTFTFTDLLADVLIYPSGLIKVEDLDELAEALEKKLITSDQLLDSLRKLDALLQLIYDGTLLPALEGYWPED